MGNKFISTPTWVAEAITDSRWPHPLRHPSLSLQLQVRIQEEKVGWGSRGHHGFGVTSPPSITLTAAPVPFHSRWLLLLLASFIFCRTEGSSTDLARQPGRADLEEVNPVWAHWSPDLGEAVPGWGGFCDCVKCSSAYIAGGGWSRAAQDFHQLDGGRLEAADLTLRTRMDMSALLRLQVSCSVWCLRFV
jgi:hypothetical protein